ncbi:hypothetical protein CO174_05495 [Candidatus Uhrbacteria bacterium CG_4_9_14_3_um_filter_50_9]|uniref:Vitamin K epoxide reductase domain-containing protein n=1 Tax=Candidatus Uhrbacteria bacterium CG_4_9_14_3_um_filter_50_9 TaxID=1975035 RepID=A0A2M7XAU0_9BACT|nr:MAG: hypothetical protein CO174_05495 [Candidatus Uhrbacteria bacterium CG_4_9_14_3_um_filter_50_9]
MSFAETLILIFSIIGLLDTLYLSYHAINKSPVACPFFPDEWCRKVQRSKQSRLFGFPNAFAGLLMYTLILMFLGLSMTQRVFPVWPVSVVVTIGFLFSMYFMYVQARVLKAYCTWCVLSAINFSVMFFAVLFLL